MTPTEVRKFIGDKWVDVRYIQAGLAGVALRVAPNDPGMESIFVRLQELEDSLINAYNNCMRLQELEDYIINDQQTRVNNTHK